MSGPPALVWYLAYGSNLSRRRFLCYLQGGLPPGGTDEHPPAHDPRPPRTDHPVVLGGRLWFAGSAGGWQGGGVAFADLDAPGRLRCRAWLVTDEQFDDLFAAENGRSPAPPLVLAASSMVPGEVREVGAGWYNRLRCVERRAGTAVVTFTSPERLGARPFARPSAAYLATLADGLRVSHRLGAAAVVEYLMSCPGADLWDPAELTTALAAAGDDPQAGQ